jgi:hypothetical protein
MSLNQNKNEQPERRSVFVAFRLVLSLSPPHTQALGPSYYHLVAYLIIALSFLAVSPIEIYLSVTC